MPTETLASKRAGSRPTPPSQSLSSLSPSRNDKSKLLKATRHFLISGFWSKKIPSQDSESLEEMSLERRMSMGRRKKDRGNFWYSRGEFTQAIQNYRKEEETARWRRRPWNYQSFNFLNFHKINFFTSTLSHLAVSD